jgi:hypothetical protein
MLSTMSDIASIFCQVVGCLFITEVFQREDILNFEVHL